MECGLGMGVEADGSMEATAHGVLAGFAQEDSSDVAARAMPPM